MRVLLPLLIIGVVIVVAALVAMRSGRSNRPDAVALEREIAERDAFIEHLRELAWQHRDIAPELSTIVIDEISKRNRPPLDGPR